MNQPGIVIIDVGTGNIESIWNAITSLGYQKVTLSSDPKKLKAADTLILPGVGAFAECVLNLKKRKLNSILNEVVLENKKPILGICVGMQLMANFSEEGGRHRGLGWIPGEVHKLKLPSKYAVPHVGWNDLTPVRSGGLFASFTEKPDFYFDHSFHFQCNPKYVLATCHYGQPIVAVVQRDHIFGVQFHPEKSQKNGLRIFRSFFNLVTS